MVNANRRQANGNQQRQQRPNAAGDQGPQRAAHQDPETEAIRTIYMVRIPLYIILATHSLVHTKHSRHSPIGLHNSLHKATVKCRETVLTLYVKRTQTCHFKQLRISECPRTFLSHTRSTTVHVI